MSPSRRPRLPVLLLVLVVPLLVAATALVVYRGGDEPVSDDGDGPPPSPPASDVMGTVAGTVTDADGEPVAGAAVLPTSLDEPAQPVPEIGVVTGPTGEYEWRLAPGRYELVVYLDSEPAARGAITVTAGETGTLDFAVR
jgi:hypothetical protein